MTKSIVDKLRAELLALGQTAPKSWNANKLRSEIEKAKNPTVSDGTESGDNAVEEGTVIDKMISTGGTAENPDITKETTTQIKTDTNTNTDTHMNNDSEEELNDTDEVSEDTIEVIAKAAFSNDRLGLKNISVGDKFSVSVADAEYLIQQDRTCKYADK